MVQEVVLLKNYLNSMSIPLKEEQISLLLSFMDLVLEKNKTVNLTSITSQDDFIQKHLVDSLTALKYISDNSTVLDLGVGGGFPLIPLACIKSSCFFTGVDSIGKKIIFLQDASKHLNLINTKFINSRIEDLDHLKNSFDYVTARAVGHLGLLLELTIPFLKTGGKFIAYKSNESELQSIQKELNILNCRLITIDKFNLPNSDNRCLLIFEKLAKTDKIYPRNFSLIKKRPLYEV